MALMHCDCSDSAAHSQMVLFFNFWRPKKLFQGGASAHEAALLRWRPCYLTASLRKKISGFPNLIKEELRDAFYDTKPSHPAEFLWAALVVGLDLESKRSATKPSA